MITDAIDFQKKQTNKKKSPLLEYILSSVCFAKTNLDEPFCHMCSLKKTTNFFHASGFLKGLYRSHGVMWLSVMRQQGFRWDLDDRGGLLRL